MAGAALIGCGLIGVKRSESLPPQLPLVAVYDIDTDRATAVARRYGGDVLVASSAAAAFSAPGVSAAIIATVHADLARLALAAVQSGLHVLIEKPGARRSAELDQLAKRAAPDGLVVRVGYNHRFHPALLKARELLERADYGPLMWIRGRYGHGGRPGYEKEWRAQPEVSGGGELLDQGVHLIDLVRFLEGEAELVFAELTSSYWPMPVEDNAFLCLRLGGGAVAWLHASWTEWRNLFSLEIAHARAKIEIVGLGGSYGVERLTLHEMRPEMGPPDTTAWEWPRGDISWRMETADFAAAIGGSPGLGADLTDAVSVLRLVEEAYQRCSSPL